MHVCKSGSNVSRGIYDTLTESTEFEKKNLSFFYEKKKHNSKKKIKINKKINVYFFSNSVHFFNIFFNRIRKKMKVRLFFLDFFSFRIDPVRKIKFEKK